MNYTVTFRRFLRVTVIVSLISFSVFAQIEKDLVEGNLIQFNDNGAWCWYQDERVVVDITNGKIILGADESGSGVGGNVRNGVIFAIIFDLESGTSKRYELAKFSCDDHNAPGFIIRPDGKYLAMYAEHYDYYNSRYRIFDGTSWIPEQRFNWMADDRGTNYTIAYSNLYYLSAENRMYNFARATNRTPNFLLSTNQGDTWSWGGQLTTNTSNSYNKGYYKYWSNGVDRIDFIFTEQHPRDTSTSIYHGYLKDGKAYASDGTVADEDIRDTTFIPGFWDFTKVFSDNTVINGITMRRCWNADVVRYDDGTIATIITARNNNNTQGGDNGINPEHSFIYCRFNGTSWNYAYLGSAGYKMYASEADYTGLGAVHPNDPNTIYISTSIDPRDNSNLIVREIFKGVTNNNGAAWTWNPVTRNSTRDNFRPVIPAWDNNNTALLWFRGTYFTAQRFDAAVVGIIERSSENPGLMQYTDASTENTTLTNGSPIDVTGPGSGMGADDDKWHIRTGWGNESSIFTSSETGNGEDAPMLKTRVDVSETGTYDVWVNFWAEPAQDWRIKAGLSSGNMQVYRHMANKVVSGGNHNYSIVHIGNNNTFLYQAYVGRVELQANSYFEVYVDDEARTGSQNSLTGSSARTWYDGVSYANVYGETLPVELSSFAALVNNSTVELNWETKTEINNHGYEVERFDNNKWRTLGFVKGMGTTSEVSTYSFVDKYPSGANIQYRLKQVDFDGLFNYSDVVEVSFASEFTLSQNYPNPFNPVTSISYSIPYDSDVELKIFNALGQEVITLLNEFKKTGAHNVTWNAVNIPSGIYFYQIKAGNNVKINKMTLLK